MSSLIKTKNSLRISTIVTLGFLLAGSSGLAYPIANISKNSAEYKDYEQRINKMEEVSFFIDKRGRRLPHQVETVYNWKENSN